MPSEKSEQFTRDFLRHVGLRPLTTHFHLKYLREKVHAETQSWKAFPFSPSVKTIFGNTERTENFVVKKGAQFYENYI